jgi:hypothetical protein
MLTKEDGPWDTFLRLRRSLGTGTVKKLVSCFYLLECVGGDAFRFFSARETLGKLLWAGSRYQAAQF